MRQEATDWRGYKGKLIVEAVRILEDQPDLSSDVAWMRGVHRYGFGKISGWCVKRIAERARALRNRKSVKKRA